MKNLIICLAILIFGFSCNAGEFYEEGDIEFKSIKDLNNCPVNILNSEHEDQFLVVNSIEELESQILWANAVTNSCTSLKEALDIDFSSNTLLIGKKRIPHIEGELISERVFRSGSAEYTYEVSLWDGGYTAIGQFRFGVIIPKIPKGSKVNFDIEIRERI